VLALDRRGALRPVAIQSAEGERLLAGVPVERRLISAHAVTADGRVFSAGDAAAPITAALSGGGVVVAPVLRMLGPVTRGVYRLIARNRSRLGRLVTPAMLERADAVLAARA
jgi:predicted DCC family thiol-disulfide oxidoreductase YuxK